MKKALLMILALVCLSGCSKKEADVMNCKIFWQLYHTPKYLDETEIEKAFQETFYGFYERVNDNSVIARNTTTQDVRSLTLKLATMADQKLEGSIDPQLDYQVEVRVFIDFNGRYIEEIWSKIY